MKKNALFTVSLLSVFISLSCYAYQDVILHADSLSDAKVSINDDTGKTQIEVINTNQDGTAHIYYNRLDVGNFGLSLKNNAEAELIINEVVSKDVSTLRGELELQGKKATVVIANPNGISCRDCSFSGINDIKLIAGSSTGKFSKTFTIADIGSSVVFDMRNKLDKNEHSHIHRNYNDISSGIINIISNNVDLIQGDLNAEYIRFDMGLSEFNLGAKNDYNKQSHFLLRTEAGINSRYLIIKTKEGNIYNYGNINTLSLNHESYGLINMGKVYINQDDNLYRTAYDGTKQSKVMVYQYSAEINNSSFNVKNSILFMKADLMFLDRAFNIDDSYLYGMAGTLKIDNISLLNNSVLDIVAEDSISLGGKIQGHGHVILQLNDDKVDIEGKNLLIGTEGLRLEGGTKYKLGRSTIIDYSKYK
ncbi:filamentous hemagglutinin N-terminal domain-containing protein [Proteus mirabilis]|uniref:filamentous hemagglutinin N-terminal domain-containing protein n=1 Tax=Proteus mirabilis TaxID=584 RepID=UPI0005382785|nr:filamentous hemagglutinin N-terminal domain-containing protein [Proteus mirabilis]AUU35761.1 filamentous hemagglutinin N-terminal domain-containing protein [Proteus mirabilis]EKU3801585.1 filamentous hemagglutinin N-terminal domain-containing protein [Proteus mirabilis]ELA9918879.1 filamentous hemagglutinin N-terminal domain-containing protein [Proteus mirabilis]ELD1833473.1 filamentous hemagglutinin N-terminal domain-containing protein [Proteus mirabilis]HCT9099905.1 filamentous hemaggluti